MKNRMLLSIATLFVAATHVQAAPVAPSTSLNMKMTEFVMPAGYECPLFSNSPYSDMLTAIDKMQENINSIFPACESNVEKAKIVQTSTELQDKIKEAQKLQKTGQTFKLGQTADMISKLTQGLQKSLVILANAQTKACYRSEAEFRNTVFSINDTFQSLSPLVMDLVTKTPGLGKALGPTITILSSADALSKSITLLEQVAKNSVQFNMSNIENRMNTVKNVCQFMKVYNRLELLRLSRLGQIQKVHAKFQTDIQQKNVKVEELKKAMPPLIEVIEPDRSGAEGASLTISAEDEFQESKKVLTESEKENQKISLYEELKSNLSIEQNKLQKALAVFDSAKTEDQFPEIAQCQTIKSTLTSSSLNEFKQKFESFAYSIQDKSDYRLQLDVLKAYEEDLTTALSNADRDRCSRLGIDLLKKLDVLFATTSGTLTSYENALIEQKGENFLLQQKNLSEKKEAAAIAEADYANVKTMLNFVSFEASEVEKRAKGLHKYLFAGPDQILTDCDTRAEDKKCGVLERVLLTGLTYYQKSVNHGPVFELFKNNEDYFNDSFKKMNAAMVAIQKYEDSFVTPFNTPYINTQFIGKKTQKVADQKFKDYIEVRDANAFGMSHINPKFLIKGSYNHSLVCMNTKLLLDHYIVASTHLMSTKGLCQIVTNVLGEPQVSKKLRNYCLPANDKTPAIVDQLQARLVGEYDGTTTARQGNITLSFNRSPKAFVDQLLANYKELDCP